MGNEEKCYKLLDELGIEYSFVTYTKEEKENHELVDELIGVKGIKNLLFKTRNLKKELFFVILPREKRFDTKAFRNRFNITKIEMVDDIELKEFLNATNGDVSILDLLYDKDKKIKLYIDKEVLQEEYFRFHPFNGLITVKIKTVDLLDKLIPYLGHDLIEI